MGLPFKATKLHVAGQIWNSLRGVRKFYTAGSSLHTPGLEEAYII